jgi:hypothetical protein
VAAKGADPSVVDALLDGQGCSREVGFIQVRGITPAQHGTQVRILVAAEGTTEEHLGIGGGCSEHGVVDASGCGNLAGIVRDRKGAGAPGITTPRLAIGSRTPQRLIGSLERVLCQRGSDGWRG